jgi:hypothetical protein
VDKEGELFSVARLKIARRLKICLTWLCKLPAISCQQSALRDTNRAQDAILPYRLPAPPISSGPLHHRT